MCTDSIACKYLEQAAQLRRSKRRWRRMPRSYILNCFSPVSKPSVTQSTHTSEPTRKHFVEALGNVMSDKQCQSPQKDPLKIIPAWKTYDAVRPLIFTKKAVLTPTELSMKHAVDKRFKTYMQVCFFLDLGIGDCNGNDFSL